MIKKMNAVVYFAPTRGRRFLSKSAAISAEARAIIYKKYPIEPFEPDTGHRYDIKFDEPSRYQVMHRRLSKILAKTNV